MSRRFSQFLSLSGLTKLCEEITEVLMELRYETLELDPPAWTTSEILPDQPVKSWLNK